MAAVEAAMGGEFAVDMREIATEQKNDKDIGESEEREIAGVLVLVHPKSKKILVPTRLRLRLVQNYHDLLLHPGRQRW
ncbi:hypothetical protein GN244_ATG03955 [Phytophthora infestans]|uniref:Uncharacterized protein n=1 Tax=Phytophthora infestans TaxID=4787 RepID=A0A833WK42_PHYIN|nr:hypothetical protein GN244_ATG03955 [Phytophthora infestans]